MITLTYNPNNGFAYVDNAWPGIIDSMVEDEEFGLNNGMAVGNSFPILYLLTLVAEQKISHESVQFGFDSNIIKPNEYGAILDWPTGFCDAEDRLASRRLRAQVRRRREKRQGEAVFSDNRDRHDEE